VDVKVVEQRAANALNIRKVKAELRGGGSGAVVADMFQSDVGTYSQETRYECRNLLSALEVVNQFSGLAAFLYSG
jgi:hypothetical protein